MFSIRDALAPYAGAIKIVAAVAGLALVVFVAFKILAWDRGRLTERYNDGRNDERHLWEEGQRLATERQLADQLAAERASAAAGEGARSGAAQDASARAEATQIDVNTITKGHADARTPACTPDSGPQPLPRGVLDALDQARGRASRAARASGR